MFDETARISCLSGISPQLVFQWRERTDPPVCFNRDPPQQGRDMQVHGIFPPQHQHTAEHRVHNEQQVNNHYCIR